MKKGEERYMYMYYACILHSLIYFTPGPFLKVEEKEKKTKQKGTSYLEHKLIFLIMNIF